MTLDRIVDRATKGLKGSVFRPLIILRLAEAQHRKGGGARPEVILLAPSFHHDFMKAYAAAKQMAPDGEKDQYDLEKPHLLGLPIRCDDAMTDNDIMFYVPPDRNDKPMDRPIILLP